MMENLVIHPRDPTTVFLTPIYEKVANKTVIAQEVDPDSLKDLIKESNRVMAMGHGSANGLFSINLFSGWNRLSFFAIGDDDADLLRDKDQSIYIWCHANQFVDFHNLKGFYSGMFISEVTEAIFCGLRNINQKIVDESNKVFSEAVGDNIELSKEDLYEKVVVEYGALAKSNPVALYNLERICIR